MNEYEVTSLSGSLIRGSFWDEFYWVEFSWVLSSRSEGEAWGLGLFNKVVIWNNGR